MLKISSPNYLVFMLFLVSVVNFLDRQVLAIVQEDVKAEFLLSDSQLGLLALVFGVVHGLFALPVGRLADRVARKKVLLGCLAVWSSITMLTAVTTNFFQLAVTRVGVALGESGVTPTSYALIADRVPVDRRASAIAIVGAGAPIGLMLSLFFGGAIADAFGWRMTFVLFGVPGLLLALICWLTLESPSAGAADGVVAVRTEAVGSVLTGLFGNRAYLLLIAAATAQSVVTYGVIQWMPSFLIRKFDLPAAEVGMTLGPLLGVFGILGLLSAAFLSDRVASRDRRWYCWIAAGAAVGAWPFFAVAIHSDNYGLTLTLFALFLILVNSPVGITNAMIQTVAPVQRRGVAAGLKTVSLSFLGYGVGGAIIGALSDYFAQGDPAGALGPALFSVSFFLFFAASAFYLCAAVIRDAIDVAKAESNAR